MLINALQRTEENEMAKLFEKNYKNNPYIYRMDNWADDAKSTGIALAADPVIANNEPDDEAIEACKALGAALV